MRARPNLTGDQLVQAYMHRVAAAARHLPKGARIAFVGRIRAQIDRQIGAEGTADPGRVAGVLAALGEPEDLVRAERLRIDSKWLKSRGRDGGSEEATTAAVPTSTPRVYRPLRSRWRPAAPAIRPLPRDAVTGPEDAPDGAEPREPDATVPPPWPGDLDAMMPPGPVVEEGRPSRGGPTPLDGVWQLATGHKLESIAVVVLGLGGLILPFPLWLAGALLATVSRLFDGWDKTLAWLGPPLFALAGSVVTALFMGGKQQNPIMIYTGALRADFGLLVRFGCVLSAGYLAWRVRKGRRVKVPPWKR